MSKISISDIKKLRDKTSAGLGLCKEALQNCQGDMKKAEEYINERSDAISRLHDVTGAKIGLCKTAFEDAGKNFEKAVELIKERGWQRDTSEDGDRCSSAKDGVISAYVHGTDQKTVALTEVICTTDFVARNDNFRNFAYEIAMQVAAMKPQYVSKNDIPEEEVQNLRRAYEKEAKEEGKPEDKIEKIVEGKLEKLYKEKCLLEQTWFKDDSKTIQNLLDENVQQLGEPITIRRILVWQLGE